MERLNLAARSVKKTGSGFEAAKRVLYSLMELILPGRLSRAHRHGERPSVRSGLESALAREIGSSPNNPYAMYTPGRYTRGC